MIMQDDAANRKTKRSVLISLHGFINESKINKKLPTVVRSVSPGNLPSCSILVVKKIN